MSTINWSDPKSQVSTHFSVGDCITLPTWGRLANEADGLTDTIKDNLVHLCANMEGVRAYLGNRPIQVHCTYRPEAYNKIIGGAPHSSHVIGMAMDFHVEGLSDNKGCDSIRLLLQHKLQEFGIRMEDVSEKSNRTWIHIDLSEPHPNRFFKP